MLLLRSAYLKGVRCVKAKNGSHKIQNFTLDRGINSVYYMLCDKFRTFR